ncbi:MAG: hypothetical protein K0U93_14445, partial [Gammaproteobacteria bacterium]|nr:hypothetical protein [Gammaproteobacteria bacterium]
MNMSRQSALLRRKSIVLMRPVLSLVLILGLVGGSAPSIVHSDALLGAEANTLAREPQVTPADLGDGVLEGLQYADPAEQLDLIEPPVADNFGDAQLEHPITIPVGRAGHEPTLALSYDSGGGAGWVGTGWDLGVGEIVVDTRFGAPRYQTDAESEGYMLDGDILSPTAVVANFQSPRVTDRSDFTRRIEGEFERIIRRGDGPTNYRWEVTDKNGTIRYYGANLDGTLRAEAVQTDAAGNIFRWALSAEKDISSNIIRYFYANVAGQRVGADSVSFGTHLYLTRILYTGSLGTGVADDPAYEILFLRDGDITPTPTARKDIVIDARGGFVDTTSDLLRRIQINYGPPVDNGNTARTSWPTLARAYNLNYVEGAFGKSLLTSVEQLDSANTVVASHTFTYYDDVRNGAAYNGLASPATWSPGDDNVEKNLIEIVESSALGGSDTTSEDVHAYIGFNPAIPGKTGSFGGAFSVDASQTEGIVEFMDINGDLLPDKVFRESNNDPVKFRLNQSGPGGGTSFGPVMTVGNGFTDLSYEASFGITGGAEAYPAIAVQFSVAGDVSLGTEYFDDVNNDGLPDYIRNGVVFFNRTVNGVPTFLPESGGSPVPLEAATATVPVLSALAAFEQLQRDQSVVVDTVRRWTAPFAGTIDISAPVTFSPPTGMTSPDGVRVAIQVGSNELWSTTMTAANATATPSSVTGITVAKGT